MRIWDNEYKVAGRALGISLRLVVAAPIVFKLRFWAESARDKISRYKRGETFSVFLEITCQDFFADCPKDSLVYCRGLKSANTVPGLPFQLALLYFLPVEGVGGRAGGWRGLCWQIGRQRRSSQFFQKWNETKKELHSSFLFTAESYSIVWMYHSLFIHLLTERHLYCFQVLAIMRKLL